MTLTPIEPRNEASITLLLEQTNASLNEAVKRSDLVQIGNIKAQAATVHEATKQLNLSKEIQLDAQEMIRRSEFWLGKAIRQGQEEGSIRVRGQRGPQSDYTRERDGRVQHIAGVADSGNCLPGIKDIAPDFYDNGSQIGQLSDGVDPDDFEAALSDAKAEGNLSRANVVRKVKGAASPQTREARADLIADLAAQGYSSRQMPEKVGVSEETVRQIARDYDIDIPGDRAMNKTRRINSTQVVENTATALEGLLVGVELVDYSAVDPAVAGQWAASIKDSLRVLNKFAKRIDEVGS